MTSRSRPGLLALDLVAASAAVRSGRVDPVALTIAHLDHAVTSTLNDWFTLDGDGAVAAAQQAAAEIRGGAWRGPLHGLPVGVKDLFDTAGLRTTYGSPRFVDHVPERDAAVVTRLRDAGAVMLGKQATHEFAWGGRTDSRYFGPTLNPHDPTRIPGGSSGGGAAAIVSGSGLLAIGSDTAGSVRIPAALSGCVGYKPTRNWCPLTGAFPLAPSLDHVGLITRTVADAATAFQALGGTLHAPRGAPLRVGLLVGDADTVLVPAIREALHTAARMLTGSGEVVEPVALTRVDESVRAILEVIRSEAGRVHRDAYRADPDSYGRDLATLLEMDPISADERAAVEGDVRRAVGEAEGLLRSYDVLLGATVPVTAPRIGQKRVTVAGRHLPVELALTRLTSLADAGGMPALSVPFPAEDLPIGIHLVAARDDDGTLLAAGAALERALAE